MRQHSIDSLVQVIATAWDCSPRAVNPSTRSGNGLFKRFVTVQILTEEGFNASEICAYFPNLKRNSVVYSLRLFAQLLDTHKEVKQLYLKAAKAVEDQDNDYQAISTAI